MRGGGPVRAGRRVLLIASARGSQASSGTRRSSRLRSFVPGRVKHTDAGNRLNLCNFSNVDVVR